MAGALRYFLLLIFSFSISAMAESSYVHPALAESPNLTLATSYKAWQTGSGFSAQVLKKNFFNGRWCTQNKQAFAGCLLAVQEMSSVVNGLDTIFFFSGTSPGDFIGAPLKLFGDFTVYRRPPMDLKSRDVNQMMGEQKKLQLALHRISLEAAFSYYEKNHQELTAANDTWPLRLAPFAEVLEQTFQKIPADRQSYYAAQFYNIYLENLSDGHSFLDLAGMAKSMSVPRLSGIGSEVSVRANKMYLKPLPGSGSLAAGIHENDQLLAVDHEPVVIRVPSDLDSLQDRVRGPEGSKVNLLVQRWDTGQVLELTVTRKALSLDTVTFEIINLRSKNYGYLKVRNFMDPMVADMSMTYIIKNSKNVEGWIVDVRDNPGGSLLEAVEFLGLFLPLDTVVVGRGQVGIESVFKTSIEPMTDKKMIVLVNQKSASASESFAGAIQELKRGVIIGTATFGKGSVQDVTSSHPNDPTQNIWSNWPNMAYRQTTSRYFFPSGKTPEWYGVSPDLVAPEYPGAPEVFVPRERDLHPFSLGPLADVWTQPVANDMGAIKDCLEKGTSQAAWSQSRAPFLDYQILYAGDVLECL